MADKIKGIEIAISADTTGVTKGLKEVTDASMKTSKNLKSVESLLKLDPHNTELVAEKQKLLAQNIEQTKEKLSKLKAAQDDVKKAFERGEISEDQYIAFQGEIVKTENRLKSLEGQTKETGKAMDAAGEKTTSFGDKLKNGLGTAAKAAGVAIAAVSTAVAAGTKKLVDFTVAGGKYADEILQESAVTGIATDKLQEYKYAAELVDVSTETLTKSMSKNIKSMSSAAKGTGETAEAYKKLGVTVTNSDGSLRDSQEVYWELIDALGKVDNETERDAMAMQILGKSAQELNPLIEAGSAKMAELGKEAHEAGAVLSDDALNSFGAFDDQLQYLKVNASAAKNALGTALLPMLTNLATTGNGLLKDFTKNLADANGDAGKMAEAVGQLIPKVIDAIVQGLPEIMSAAKSIVSSLAQGIIEQLPEIIRVGLEVITDLALGIAEALPEMTPTIIDIVLEIVDTLISNVDLLVDAAIALILGLANGLMNALPRLIEKVPQIVEKLVTAVISNAPKLIKAAFELVVTLAKGLITSIPELLKAALELVGSLAGGIIKGVGNIASAAWEIVKSIGSVLGELPKKALQWGKDMIQGFVNGIKAVKDKVKDAVSGVGEKIKSFLHFSRPDEGPLRDYETWMPDMMKGLAAGIRKNMAYVEREVANLSAAIVPDVNLTVPKASMQQPVVPAAQGIAGVGGNSFSITINVKQFSNDYDVRRAADVMAEELNRLALDNNSLMGVVSA